SLFIPAGWRVGKTPQAASAARPVSVMKIPTVAAVLPVMANPAIARTGNHVMTRTPHMAISVPVPMPVDPDIAHAWCGNSLDNGCRRRNIYVDRSMRNCRHPDGAGGEQRRCDKVMKFHGSHLNPP